MSCIRSDLTLKFFGDEMKTRSYPMPRRVGLIEIKKLMLSLGIVYKKGGNRIPDAKFRLDERREVCIDLSEVEVITAEAAVLLDALLNWIQMEKQNNQSSTGNVTTSDDKWKRKYIKTSEEGRLRPTSSLLLVPVKIVSIPNLNNPKNENLASLARIHKQTAGLVKEIDSRLARIRPSNGVILKDWMMEFLSEALLNVGQHSDITGESEYVSAFVGAGYLAGNDMRAIANSMQSDSESELAEHAWVARNIESTRGFLDIAVGDAGMGVPITLREAYSESLDADLQTNEMDGITDDEILVWALTPYGSRKHAQEHFLVHENHSWRGLYRLLKRSCFHDGMLRIISANGEMGGLKNTEGKTVRLSATGKRPPSPITVVRSVLPIDLRMPRRPEKRAAKPRLIGVGEVKNILCPVIRGFDGLLNENSIDNYCKELEIFLDEELRTGLDDDERPIVLIHPIGSVGKPELDGRYRASEQDLERVASLIARVLVGVMIPTQRIVHAFIPYSNNDRIVESLADYLKTKLASAHSLVQSSRLGILGLFAGVQASVGWIKNIDSESVHPVRGREDLLWSRLIAYQPAAEILAGEKYSILSEELMLIMRSKYLESRVLAQTMKKGSSLASWYWEAPTNSTGEALQLIRTRSGKPSSQYLSVFRFCREHPSFQDGLAYSLATAIRKWYAGGLDQNQAVVIYPDSESSNFLLDRILGRVRSYLAAIQKHQAFLYSKRGIDTNELAANLAVVFSDFRYEGTSVSKKMSELGLLANSNQKEIKAFVVVDQDRAGPDPNGLDQDSIYIFAKFNRVKAVVGADNVAYLSVDPITNELISSEQTANIDLLNKLTWRLYPQDRDVDWSGTRFKHGIERIGGAYSVFRWPVEENIRKGAIRGLLVSRLKEILQGVEVGESICFCTRVGSSISKYVRSLVSDAMEELYGVTEIGRASVWMSEFTPHTFHGRQIFGGSIQQAIHLSVPIFGFNASSSGLGRQMALLLGDGDSESQVNRRFEHVVYIENSAVTGGSISEFMLAISGLVASGELMTRRLVLFPIISRLNYVEESILRMSQINVPPSLRASSAVRLEFFSLLQLRIRAYSHPSVMPLTIGLRKLVDKAVNERNRDLCQIRESIHLVVLDLEESDFQRDEVLSGCVFGLLGGQLSENFDVSVRCVEFRQLVSLLLQGIPCTALIKERLDELISLGDEGLVHILAYEPDLLSGDPLFFELNKSFRDYVVSIISKTKNPVLKINGLWVLSQITGGLSSCAEQVCIDQHEDSLSSKVFLFLVLYALDGRDRLRTLEFVESLLAVGSSESWMRSDALSIVKAAAEGGYQARNQPIQSNDEARGLILNYFRRGTDDHLSKIAVEWSDVCAFLGVDKRSKAVDDQDIVRYIPNRKNSVRKWLYEISIPLQRSLEFLGSTLGPALSSCIAQEREYSIQCLVDFEIALEKFLDGSLSKLALSKIWFRLIDNCIWQTADRLYCSLPRVSRSDLMGIADAGKGRVSQSALGVLVNSPIFLLLSLFADPLEPNRSVSIVVETGGGDGTFKFEGIVADLPNSMLLKDLWFISRLLPILKGSAAEDFRSLSQLLWSNLVRYSNPSFPIEVGVLFRANALNLSIVSKSKSRLESGKGSGLKTIRRLCDNWGWTCVGKVMVEKPDFYRTELHVVVDMLNLS